ncbi:hypothetical protein Bca101_048136 [Brassica carinata]
MAKPETVPPKIRDSTRFYPYFKDCVGAIDGTHILAMIMRNVIERIFGIFKSRFLIFKSTQPFPYKTQVELVLACVVLHNYLRKECRSDVFPEEVVVADDNESDVQEIGEDENMDDDVQNVTQEQQRVNANNWRANIAATMWTDAMHMGS